MRQQHPNATISTITMVAPTGVLARMDRIIPKKAQNTERAAENMVTFRKLLNRRIDESAGNITNADMRREPTRFIASTMMTAIMTAIRRLYLFAFVPDALAKFSSKVTANILL